jgi:hypothetical protein
MINKITQFFKGNKEENHKYKGLSDFFRHAPKETKEKVIAEAARRANEDQLKVFNDARVKMGTR